jgi:thioesterase domain-containing protein
VHPVGSHILCYAPLASHWDADRPLYGLQAEGLEAGQVPSERIDEMARHYLEAIRRVQPEGPYLLGGWPVGGVVAFEMARQLQAQKQEVALLALFDSQIPAGRKAPSDDVSQLISFAADKSAQATPEFVRSWERMATEGVEWYFVPGNHYTIVREPHVGVLSAHLKDCIERADENAS